MSEAAPRGQESLAPARISVCSTAPQSSGAGIPQLVSHVVAGSAYSRNDAEQRLLGSKLGGDGGLAAVAVARRMRLCGRRIGSAGVDERITPGLRNEMARLVGRPLQLLDVDCALRYERSAGADIDALRSLPARVRQPAAIRVRMNLPMAPVTPG